MWLLNPASGYPLALIDEFNALTYTKIVNGIGAFTLTLPKTFDMSLVQEDTRVAIYRKPPGGVRNIDFAGFVRKIEKPTQQQQQSFVLSGFDLNDLLRRHIVAYASGTAQASKAGKAGDVLKAIVRENLGSSAVAARDLTAWGFTVASDAGLGTTVELAFAWRQVLLVLQEIADASHRVEATSIYFGIVPLNNGWECEFRTNVLQWGADHRFPSGAAGPVIFGLEFANIAEANRIIDWSSEVNYAYAGGQGEGTLRVVKQSQDAVRIGVSPFNRCETFFDARNSPLDNQVQAAADGAVRDGRPRSTFTGKVLNNSQIYGRDWGHGDYVTGVYLGETVSCRIDAVAVTIQNGQETVDATLRSDT